MNAFDRMVREGIARLCAVTGYSEEELREMGRVVEPPLNDPDWRG